MTSILCPSQFHTRDSSVHPFLATITGVALPLSSIFQTSHFCYSSTVLDSTRRSHPLHHEGLHDHQRVLQATEEQHELLQARLVRRLGLLRVLRRRPVQLLRNGRWQTRSSAQNTAGATSFVTGIPRDPLPSGNRPTFAGLPANHKGRLLPGHRTKSSHFWTWPTTG